LAEKQPSLDFVSPTQLGGTVAFCVRLRQIKITATAIAIDGGWTAQ
jgi:3-hydroxybutyrate dehydrogenase